MQAVNTILIVIVFSVVIISIADDGKRIADLQLQLESLRHEYSERSDIMGERAKLLDLQEIEKKHVELDYISSETFLDEVIRRINRKQLK